MFKTVLENGTHKYSDKLFPQFSVNNLFHNCNVFRTFSYLMFMGLFSEYMINIEEYNDAEHHRGYLLVFNQHSYFRYGSSFCYSIPKIQKGSYRIEVEYYVSESYE